MVIGFINNHNTKVKWVNRSINEGLEAYEQRLLGVYCICGCYDRGEEARAGKDFDCL